MRAITVVTDKQGIDHYYYEGMPITVGDIPTEYISKRKYACLSDALKDSEPYTNDNYSDGECLDYVLNVIKQLEERS